MGYGGCRRLISPVSSQSSLALALAAKVKSEIANVEVSVNDGVHPTVSVQFPFRNLLAPF